MKKKTIALFILLFAAFFGLQTGTSAAESHVEGEDAVMEEPALEVEAMAEMLSLEALKDKQISELTDEERAFVLQELGHQIALLQEAVEELQVLVAQVIEARSATFVAAPVPTPAVSLEAPTPIPIAVEEVEVIDLNEEQDLFASIQGQEEEVDVDALFAGTDIDSEDGQSESGSRLLAAATNPENRGAFVLVAAFIVGGILFALSRRKKGPKPAPKPAEQKVEKQPATPSLDQAPWG